MFWFQSSLINLIPHFFLRVLTSSFNHVNPMFTPFQLISPVFFPRPLRAGCQIWATGRERSPRCSEQCSWTGAVKSIWRAPWLRWSPGGDGVGRLKPFFWTMIKPWYTLIYIDIPCIHVIKHPYYVYMYMCIYIYIYYIKYMYLYLYICENN